MGTRLWSTPAEKNGMKIKQASFISLPFGYSIFALFVGYTLLCPSSGYMLVSSILFTVSNA